MASQVSRPDTAFSIDRRSRQRQPRQHAEAHLAWIRTLPSIVPGLEKVEAAHVRYQDPRYAKPSVGMAEKPDDKWVVPLAADQHRRQHSMSERSFWKERGIDPVFAAALLWVHTGNDEAAKQIIRNAKIVGGMR